MDTQQIYTKLKHQLENNKNTPNPKIMVCFSGIPGSGKTTLAEKLEKQLQAIRISNDDIRTIIESSGVTERDEREEAKEKFLDWFLNEVQIWPNGLLIMDSSIDRRFDDIKRRFNEYRLYVISLGISRELAIKRMKKRQGHRAKLQPMIDTMDKWIEDKRRFDNEHGQEIDKKIDTTNSAVRVREIVDNISDLIQSLKT